MFFLISSFLEIISVFLSMKIMKKDSLSSLNFGIAMNTRGGPGIVVASIALECGIINEKLFVALILTAITTSLLTGTWFKFIIDRKLPLT
jgi:Kef-type K+ transport system membrane component KefB